MPAPHENSSLCTETLSSLSVYDQEREAHCLGPFSNDGNCVKEEPNILYSEGKPGSRAAAPNAQQLMVLDGGDCPCTPHQMVDCSCGNLTAWHCLGEMERVRCVYVSKVRHGTSPRPCLDIFSLLTQMDICFYKS